MSLSRANGAGKQSAIAWMQARAQIRRKAGAVIGGSECKRKRWPDHRATMALPPAVRKQDQRPAISRLSGVWSSGGFILMPTISSFMFRENATMAAPLWIG